jgi:hypothetical protein
VPHHRVTRGYRGLIPARVFALVGPFGLNRATAEQIVELKHLRSEAEQQVAATQHRLFGRVRATLEYARHVADLLSNDPPYPLLFGLTLEMLTPQQLQSALERMDAQQRESLKRHNPKLAQAITQQAQPTLLPWDTSLREVPALRSVLG